MPDFENPVTTLRRTIKHQEKKRLEPDRQAALQKAATEKHERESAEREAYEQSLIIAESEPTSQNPLAARPRLKPISQPQRVSKVAAARAFNNKPRGVNKT